MIYGDNRIGISNELSFIQLQRLAYHSVISPLCTFEIVGISEKQLYPCSYFCYGIDVASVGGYSLIGDGLFECIKDNQFDLDLNNRIGMYYPLLNNSLLFEKETDAQSFSQTINAINKLRKCSVFESDEWHLFYVYKIWDMSYWTGTE